jgi:hypothetical protein
VDETLRVFARFFNQVCLIGGAETLDADPHATKGSGIGLELPDTSRYLEAPSQAVQAVPFYSAALRENGCQGTRLPLPAESGNRRDAMRKLG